MGEDGDQIALGLYSFQPGARGRWVSCDPPAPNFEEIRGGRSA